MNIPWPYATLLCLSYRSSNLPIPIHKPLIPKNKCLPQAPSAQLIDEQQGNKKYSKEGGSPKNQNRRPAPRTLHSCFTVHTRALWEVEAASSSVFV